MSNEEGWSYLISCLGEDLNLTGREIADVLWLALQRLEGEGENQAAPQEGRGTRKKSRVKEEKSRQDEPPQGFVHRPSQGKKAPIYPASDEAHPDGLPIGIPDAPSLREPLNLLRVLHPLMLRARSDRHTIIDEEATVERIAKQSVGAKRPVWLPVLKGELEPWLDLALVIDESQSMQLWKPSVSCRSCWRTIEFFEIFGSGGLNRAKTGSKWNSSCGQEAHTA